MPPHEVDNRWSNFNVVTGQLLAAGQGGNSRTLRNIDDNNFSPRIGIAYTITPKTVIRSGFGISYDEAYNVGQRLYKNAPNFLSQSYSPSQGQTPTLLLSQAVSVPTAPPVVNGVVQIASGTLPYAWDFNTVTPEIIQWSFGIQRELAQNLVLEVSCVGARGIDLLSNVNYNQDFLSSNASSSVASRGPLANVQPNVADVQYWKTGVHPNTIRSRRTFKSDILMDLLSAYLTPGRTILRMHRTLANRAIRFRMQGVTCANGRMRLKTDATLS